MAMLQASREAVAQQTPSTPHARKLPSGAGAVWPFGQAGGGGPLLGPGQGPLPGATAVAAEQAAAAAARGGGALPSAAAALDQARLSSLNLQSQLSRCAAFFFFPLPCIPSGCPLSVHANATYTPHSLCCI